MALLSSQMSTDYIISGYISRVPFSYVSKSPIASEYISLQASTKKKNLDEYS